MNANEPAYPVPAQFTMVDGLNSDAADPGLTKREWFAAMAMTNNVFVSEYGPKDCADWVVKYTDALIDRLAETEAT